MYACIAPQVRTYVNLCVRLSVFLSVYTYVRTYVRMYVCMYVCMHACMYPVYPLKQVMSFSCFWKKKNGCVLAFINLVPSVLQSIVTHTYNYIQRNGTEQKYPELLAGPHDTRKGNL